MDEVYNQKILEFAANIPAIGILADADASAQARSKLCGSKVKVYLKVADGRVTGFSHEVKACALGQASSSIMARNIIGASADELRAARAAMLEMLREGGEGPEGCFADMRYLLPVRDYKARHASTMLTFDAVVDCLDQIEKAGEERRGELESSLQGK
jgi:NifU-like protein involved in Fe-S cluster formation